MSLNLHQGAGHDFGGRLHQRAVKRRADRKFDTSFGTEFRSNFHRFFNGFKMPGQNDLPIGIVIGGDAEVIFVGTGFRQSLNILK